MLAYYLMPASIRTATSCLHIPEAKLRKFHKALRQWVHIGVAKLSYEPCSWVHSDSSLSQHTAIMIVRMRWMPD